MVRSTPKRRINKQQDDDNRKQLTIIIIVIIIFGLFTYYSHITLGININTYTYTDVY